MPPRVSLIFVVLAALVYGALGVTLWSDLVHPSLYHTYLRAVRSEYPLWLNSTLNPTPLEERYARTLEEMRDILRERGGNPESAPRIFSHLLVKWPGGILGRGVSHALFTAQDMGLLDAHFLPVSSASYVDEEQLRLSELRSLGGEQAVRAYRDTMATNERFP